MFDYENEFDEEVDLEGEESTYGENQDINEDGTEATNHEKPKANDVPLSRFLEEKQKRKDLEKRLRSYEDNEVKNKYKEKWVNKGFEDDYAEAQADIEYKIHLQDAKLKDMELDAEISTLSKEDEYFSDATSYKSEIKAKMKEKGLTAEEAYLILRKKSRNREVQIDMEQKELAGKRGNGSVNTNPTSSPSNPRNPYPLDDADKKALLGLQRMMPSAGWNAEKYYKSRYGKK